MAAEPWDLAVLGAGPAGLEAARQAGRAGLRVVVLDAAAGPGGQYHRPMADGLRPSRPGALHHGWTAARERLEELDRAPGVALRQGVQVWAVSAEDDRISLHTLAGGGGDVIARALVVASGAVERVLPFPGWDLPGVLTAGGAQALLKGQGVRVGDRVVVAGTGPLLLAVAAALVRSGTEVVAVCDANGPRSWARGGGALVSPRRGVEAAGYLTTLARARVPVRPGTAVVAGHGRDRIEAVTVGRVDGDWRPRPGGDERVAVDAVCVSVGFAPAVEVPAALGCALTAGTVPGVAVDLLQRTDRPGVYAAGEVTGIAGAAAAEAEGAVAGLAVAHDLGAEVDRSTLTRWLGRRRRAHRFAAGLERAFPIGAEWPAWLDDDTLVCRCEEVGYGRVRDAIRRAGARDPRSVKLTTRCGMGYCQARICGPIVGDLLHHHTGRVPPDAAALVRRPVTVPVPLGQL